MNNTITSFSLHNKFRTIPILTKIIQKVSKSKAPYTQIHEKKHKKQLQLNQKVVPSIKRLNENLKKKINNNNKKIFNNNINIIKFNKDICSKTTNNYFIGKKIFCPNIL